MRVAMCNNLLDCYNKDEFDKSYYRIFIHAVQELFCEIRLFGVKLFRKTLAVLDSKRKQSLSKLQFLPEFSIFRLIVTRYPVFTFFSKGEIAPAGS